MTDRGARGTSDAGRSGGRGPAAYAGATLGLAVLGVAAAAATGAPARATGVGAAAAWAIQAGAIWKLAGVLDRGANAVPAWAGGMAARLAGLAAVWFGGSATPLERDALVLAYGVAILALLLLEAAWLARRNAGRWPRPAREEGRPGRGTEDESDDGPDA